MTVRPLSLLAQLEPGSIETPAIEWVGLVPLLILLVGAIVMLTVASLADRSLPSWSYAALTVALGVAAIVACIPLWRRVQRPEDGPFSTIADTYGVDGFSIFLTVLLAATVILGAILIDAFVRRTTRPNAEPFVLLLLSASGGVVMASANDLIVLFLGLEILSIAVYVLAAMDLRRVQSQEAGMKYFVLGAFSSAFFLYGVALVYGATGSTNLVEIRAFLDTTILLDNGLLLLGFAMLLVGLGFKIAAVPFHSWTPDVYDGAPTPVVAYMAAGVKAAGFAAIVRVFFSTFIDYADDWQPIIYALAVLTLFVGALMGIVQTNVKRMLAYSSISHAGFILVGVQAASATGVEAVVFYLAAYAMLVIGSFSVVLIVGRDTDDHHSIDDYRGLAKRRPLLALAFSVLLFGQAGIPLTSGFVAKFGVIGAAVDARSFWLGAIAMVAAVIAAYIYLRIVVAMYLHEPATSEPLTVKPAVATVIALATAFTVVFGVFPGPVAEVAEDATPVLVAGEPTP